MNIDYLKEFVTLAQVGNYSEAAEKLYISQSSLSKHIISLESEVGAKVFDRTTHRVSLNKYGKLLLPYALKIVRSHNEYMLAIASLMAEDKVNLRLGAIPALAQYGITALISGFKKKCPEYTLSISQAGSDELKNKLRKKEIELAFIRETGEESAKQDEFTRFSYIDDFIVAVLPSSHPLSPNSSIDLTALKDMDFLLLSKGSTPQKIVVETCKAHGFTPKIYFMDHSIETLIDMAADGMGVALLTNKLAIYHMRDDIAFVPIVPEIRTRISLCHLRSIKLSKSARGFISLLNP
ncbi:MAG: LysR family transcriptional regulator [Lachnospiraceae bacterium]|jgi:DNA-binding transcriptional LysR family regulator|nr:LysR family transcriptional regulator [Lachnospiraceae bacterium]